MDKSRSHMTHEKQSDQYNGLLNSIMLDEAIASGYVNPDKTGSSSKGKTQSKPSSTDKPVNAEELHHEAEMDMEEPILNDVVNDADQPQDESDPKNDNST
ncbi:hypothetical protein Tco_0163758 [Tanacetum coccineum]